MRFSIFFLPSNKKTICQPCPSAEETLHQSIDREEVIGRDDGIPLEAGERRK